MSKKTLVGRNVNVYNATFFEVSTNTDTTEGRGREYVIGRFFSEEAAKKCGKGRYCMGTDCPIKKIVYDYVQMHDGRCFKLGDEIHDEFVNDDEDRLAALSKLTAREKKLLNITD